MKYLYTLFLVFAIILGTWIHSIAQTTLIEYNFQDSNRVADAGIAANINNLMGTLNIANPVYEWQTTAGDVPVTAQGWGSGVGSKAWYIKFSSLGYENLSLFSEQYSTPKGPRDFQVEYSLDSINWIVLPNTSLTVGSNWNAKLVNYSLPSILNNKDSVYIRWVVTSIITADGTDTVKGTGRSRIDDIIVTGDLIVSQQSEIEPIVGSETPAISSLVNDLIIDDTSDGEQVWSLILHDGPANSNDADILPTIYTSITFNQDINNTIPDWDAAILEVSLFNGTNLISTAPVITTNTITFSGLNIIVPDNGSDTISLRISLNNPLPPNSDNERFHFEIDQTDVTVAPTGSSGLGLFDISSDPNANIIEVIATQLEFINVPTEIYINEEFSATVLATDIHGNIDEDENSLVTLMREKGSGNLTSVSGLSASLMNGIYIWNDLVYDSVETFKIMAIGGGLVPGISNNIIALRRPYVLFDDFNRLDDEFVGSPSIDTSALPWNEDETPPPNHNNRIAIQNQMLKMHACFQNGNNSTTGAEVAWYDMDPYYTTTLANATTQLEWYFNFSQPRANPSGFAVGDYGVAFVLGANDPNIYTQAEGYAVIFGEAGTNDSIRLISFTNGLDNYTSIISIASPASNISAMSVRVTYNPCGQEWGLKVRNDGSTFSDPQSINTIDTIIVDSSYTQLDLRYLALTWNHNGTCADTAVFDNIYIPTSKSIAATYSWDGSEDTDYQDPLNWTPVRECPQDDDILVINSGIPFIITNVPDQTIGRLIVGNLTIAELYASTAGSTLTISGGTAEDLLVEAGSSLILDGNDPMEIHLESGATAQISGSVEFDNSTNFASVAHRLTAADSAAIIFGAGAQFTAEYLAGHPFGDTGQVNVVIFEPFATFISEDGQGPFGLAAPLSKVLFETNSRYIHRQTAILPDLANRIYADFEVEVPGDTLEIIFGSAGDSVIIDQLIIGQNSTLIVSYDANDEPLDWILYDDLEAEQDAVFMFAPDSITALSRIVFRDSINQLITGTGAIYLGKNSILELNNPNNVDLANHVTSEGSIDFIDGLLVLNLYDFLLIGEENPIASVSSYIYTNDVGRLIRSMNIAGKVYFFPIGGTTYSPAYIACASCNGETFDLGVIDDIYVNPQTQNNIINADVVDKTWDLETSDTVSGVTAEYQWLATDELPGFDRTNSFVSYWITGISNVWNPGPLGPATGNNPYRRARVITNFLGEVLYYFGIGDNFSPLPVELLSFDAHPEKEDILVDWMTSLEINNDYFLLERSADGKDFHKLAEIDGAGNSTEEVKYKYLDKDPLPGISFYRLKQVDFNGEYSYSDIVSVEMSSVSDNIKLYPIPAENMLNVQVHISNKSDYEVQIVDITGKIIYVNNLFLSQGINHVSLPIDDLNAGTYFVIIKSTDSVIKKSFIKS